VRDPERVARVWPRSWRFVQTVSAEPGSFFAFQQTSTDDGGDPSCRYAAEPEREFGMETPRDPGYVPTHFALSVQRSQEEIAVIGKREGWLCRRNDRAQFPVIELWIENVVLCELLPPDFAREYLRIATSGPRPNDGK